MADTAVLPDQMLGRVPGKQQGKRILVGLKTGVLGSDLTYTGYSDS